MKECLSSLLKQPIPFSKKAFAKKKEINIIGKIYVNGSAHKSGSRSARRREVFMMPLTCFNAHLFPECVKKTGSYLN